MKIKILAFGIAKDILGSATLEWSVAERTTVGELKKQLLEQYPKFEDLRSLAIAVNSEYSENEQLVYAEDEIVLIPPVSGG